MGNVIGVVRPWRRIRERPVTANRQGFKPDEEPGEPTASRAQGMTVTGVRRFGQQTRHIEIYSGAEYAVGFAPKISIDLLVPFQQGTKSSCISTQFESR